MLPTFKSMVRSLGLQSKAIEDCVGEVVVPAALLKSLISLAATSEGVDEEQYLSVYPDVREAIGRGVFKSALAHYVSVGYFEGRRSFLEGFDEDFYCATYLDVAKAVVDGSEQSGWSHYLQKGRHELRAANSADHMEAERWRKVLFSNKATSTPDLPAGAVASEAAGLEPASSANTKTFWRRSKH